MRKKSMLELVLTQKQAEVLLLDIDNHIESGSTIREFIDVRKKLRRLVY